VTPLAAAFLLANVLALVLLPTRWAALPLLLGACYMTLGQGIEVGPFSFPIIRILIAVGWARVLFRGERLSGPFNTLDVLMLVWAGWATFSAVFHEDPLATLVNRSGIVYNGCGIYFLLRFFCSSANDAILLCRLAALLLIPLAFAMLGERLTGKNLFAVFGGVGEWSEVRDGVIRAQGPFAHSILAGSVAAASLPMMAALWSSHRKLAAAGAIAMLSIVFLSASSGPILSAGFALLALALWPWRRHMRALRWGLVAGYVVLEVLMKAPVYFLLARVDLTGSSTSWHRAQLIDAAISHIGEWWLTGTDYTRHWIMHNSGWTEQHIDVTNYYVMMGIYGGLPLLLLFAATIAIGFSFAGRAAAATNTDRSECFVAWALGSALFAHAATFVSVAYFDQSVVFFYMTLAALCSVHGQQRRAAEASEPLGDERLGPRNEALSRS
jgi:hypothetical protein